MLGNSGLQVSLVGLGCYNFGQNDFGQSLDMSATAAVVNKCIDVGITFFDTRHLRWARQVRGVSRARA